MNVVLLLALLSGAIGDQSAAPTCLTAPFTPGVSSKGVELTHGPQDSSDPALCRRACCDSPSCTAWTLLKGTTSAAVQAPCVKGKACCYLKQAAGAFSPDPNAVASGTFVPHVPKPPQPQIAAGYETHNVFWPYDSDDNGTVYACTYLPTLVLANGTRLIAHGSCGVKDEVRRVPMLEAASHIRGALQQPHSRASALSLWTCDAAHGFCRP